MMSRYRSSIRLVAIVTIVAGLLVIIGWLTGNENLKAVVTGLVSMKFNTAICFILAAVCLYRFTVTRKTNETIQKSIIAVLLVIIFLTFLEFIFKWNIGIDEFFVTDNAERFAGKAHPGRMAVSTTCCMLLIGFAFIFIPSNKKNLRLAAQYALHTVTFIAFIAQLGYIYKVPDFYQLYFLSSMALNTAFLFFILSIAASFINYSLGLTGLFTGNRMGSRIARKLFPVVSLLILVLGLLRIQIQWKQLLPLDFLNALFAALYLVISLLVIAYVARYFNRLDAKKINAEENLKTLNANLKKLVYEKTADLQQTTERLTLATKASKIGIWDWDITNNILTWDDRMYELYGITASSFSGAYEAWENGLHPDDRKSGSLAIEMAISGKKEFDTEFRVTWPDKSVHYIKANSYTQRDAAGKAFRMTGTNLDITDRVMMQKKLAYEKEQNQKTILKTAIESQESERNQIGSELHDNVNQLLAAANMRLSLIKKGSELNAFELINESKNLIRKAVEEIHKLTHNIDTSHLDDIGLSESVKLIISQINSLHIIKIRLNQTVEGIIIPPPVALTAYRIIQEQLNNILKHAAATEVRIQLHAINDLLKLEIADNGKGADLNTIKRGIGLSNMQSRAKAYNGKVDFFTSPGKGFTVVVEIAVTQPE